MFAGFVILGSLRTNKIGKLWNERSCQSKMFVNCGKMFVYFLESLKPLVNFNEGFRKHNLDSI